MFNNANLTSHSSRLKLLASVALLLLAPLVGSAAPDAADGYELGKGILLKPQVETLVGYDDRVSYSDSAGKIGDTYFDLVADAELENAPSRYDLWAKGRYGYRFYTSEAEHNDFYTVAGRVGSDQAPFIWELSTDLTKSLDANVNYNPSTGQGPDPLLTYRANTRFSAAANISYDKKIFGKTSLVPKYNFSYFHQEYEENDITPTDWKIHQAQLLLRQQYTAKTRIAAGFAYTLQQRVVENGTIGSLLVGIDYRMTSKTSWRVGLGYSLANYDLSGEAQGIVSSLQGNWAYSKKVSFYLFGGNQFRPGSGTEGARMVYRLGYGASWRVVPKFQLAGAVLHDYEQAIGSNAGSSEIDEPARHYINLNAKYYPTKPLALTAGIRHTRDERPVPKNQLYLEAIYRFY